MDVRQARYFAAACRVGSLSGAARELGVSVQAVSKAISELEAPLAAPLLLRGEKGVAPTASGLGLLGRANALIEAYDELELTISGE